MLRRVGFTEISRGRQNGFRNALGFGIPAMGQGHCPALVAGGPFSSAGVATNQDDVAKPGRELATLRDAGHYITTLPKAKQQKLEWHLATGLLLSAAESGGILMMAEIAMRRAIGHGRSKPPQEPRRKWARKYNIVEGEARRYA
jgi:hypothetical protein